MSTEREKIIEAMARAIYIREPYRNQETDLDGRPTGPAYDVSWEAICECHAEAADDLRKSAKDVLVAICEQGYAVVPNETNDVLCESIEAYDEPGLSSADAIAFWKCCYRLMISGSDIAREPAPQIDPADPREPQNDGAPIREAALAAAPQNTTRADE